MKELIENFNTQEKCDEYRKQLKGREWEIYWKDTGGVVIRESEFHDMAGDNENFATIQLCDWYGWNDGEVNEHKYTFAVFLYEDGNENGYSMYDTIEEAVEGYKRTCNKLKVKEYFETINLNRYDLGGCEFGEDDFETIAERVYAGEGTIEQVTDAYLYKVREVLDEGLEDISEEV